MVDKIVLYNEFFSAQERIELYSVFAQKSENVSGQIIVQTEKGPLPFSVEIPLGYPLGNSRTSIVFTCDSISGYEHQNFDNSICLHPSPTNCIEEKLQEEINLLYEWIDYYYVEESRDSNYGYLLTSPNNVCLLFDETPNSLIKNDSGYFLFKSFGRDSLTGVERIIVTKIGVHDAGFANHFLEYKQEKPLEGIWIYIKDEPVIERRKAVLSWEDLQPYLTSTNVDSIYQYHRDVMRGRNKPDNFLVLLGHDIPTDNGHEIHWVCVRINTSNLPIEGVKISGEWRGQSTNQRLDWCSTVNCSYARYFGRGKLSDAITLKNILLIGTGAIGSSLAKTLVRGGIRRLTIIDFDVVEAGNICRSEFTLNDIAHPKVYALISKLIAISPFVDVKPLLHLDKRLPDDPHYIQTKEFLNSFELIFDCSTDMEIAYMMDKMSLSAEIFNLSITNKANELICVHGKTTISKQKHQIFETLSPESQQANFYPEVGCQYPTFEAGYTDLNALLQFAVKNINHKYEKGFSQSTFVLRPIESEHNYKIVVDEY
ncbi:MAG: ThiF family adenylyltransferase [Flavobacteriales bacterium]|nr:ThiF family adenylyltransferase [Flavobacteriales bacterium]